MDKATVEACAMPRDWLDCPFCDGELVRDIWAFVYHEDPHSDCLLAKTKAPLEQWNRRALASQDDKKATRKHRLVYNKATKMIDRVNTVTGLVADSFEPPIECDSAAPGEGKK